jgi:hypothetical protein
MLNRTFLDPPFYYTQRLVLTKPAHKNLRHPAPNNAFRISVPLSVVAWRQKQFTFHLYTWEIKIPIYYLVGRRPWFLLLHWHQKSHLHARTTSNALNGPNADQASGGDLYDSARVDGEAKALTTTHIHRATTTSGWVGEKVEKRRRFAALRAFEWKIHSPT